MTSAAITKLIDSYLAEVEGQTGFWRGTRDEVTVYVFTDDEHDRMRIMAPVGELREAEPRVLQLLLNANYDRALDAHYAMRGLELWAVSVHPLATLAPDDFASYLQQVVALVRNTGSTYASSDLVFVSPLDAEGGGEEGEAGNGAGGDDDEPEGGDDEEPEDDDGGAEEPGGDAPGDRERP